MGINVQLREENGGIVDEVFDPRMVLSRAAGNGFSDSRVLRYLNPWGDAIFNQAQATDLANDIVRLKNGNCGSDLFELLSAIEPLVERLAHETHLYLWFMGD